MEAIGKKFLHIPRLNLNIFQTIMGSMLMDVCIGTETPATFHWILEIWYGMMTFVSVSLLFYPSLVVVL